MATPSSQIDRISERRRRTVEIALDHGQRIITEDGAGAVTVSEIARRMGMRSPSLYKYFPSLHALYDALFARGNARVTAHVRAATVNAAPGLDRLLTASRAMVRWSVAEPGLAALLYWRPIPGFVPSDESFAPSQALWLEWRGDLAEASRRHELGRSADSDDALRMLTVLISGICSQQLANQPDSTYEDGTFTRLTDAALEMFVRTHAPERQEP